MPHAAVRAQQRKRAKSLRRTMTRAETLLWRYLKAHHVDGLGFRRQVPIRGYIADFVCHSALLIVELDGESHDFESRQRGDARRDLWFRSEGYTVLRFINEDVLTNLEGVVAAIREASARGPASPPPPSPPPKGAGDPRTPAPPAAPPPPTP